MVLFRYLIYCSAELLFPVVWRSANSDSYLKKKWDERMLMGYNAVKDPEVRRKLMPNYESGCKRITPNPYYAVVRKRLTLPIRTFCSSIHVKLASVMFCACAFQTFNKPNVLLVTDPIEELTEKGIKTTKTEHEFDAIIFATGFDIIKSMNAYRLEGKGGKVLSEVMGDSPAAFNGIVVV